MGLTTTACKLGGGVGLSGGAGTRVSLRLFRRRKAEVFSFSMIDRASSFAVSIAVDRHTRSSLAPPLDGNGERPLSVINRGGDRLTFVIHALNDICHLEFSHSR